MNVTALKGPRRKSFTLLFQNISAKLKFTRAKAGINLKKKPRYSAEQRYSARSYKDFQNDGFFNSHSLPAWLCDVVCMPL